MIFKNRSVGKSLYFNDRGACRGSIMSSGCHFGVHWNQTTITRFIFFRHFGGEPLTSQHFSYKLKECIRLLGLPSSNCSSHSFRIGAATSAAMAGMSDEQIKNMGRWRSSAFKQYIRPNHLISFT